MAIPRLPQGRLYRKYVVYFLVPFSATLLASGATGLYYFYKESRTAIVALQREKALGAATHIEGFVHDIARQIRWIRLPPESGDSVLERRHVEFEKLLRFFPSVSEVSWLDGTGHEQLKVSRLARDRLRSNVNLSTTPFFRVAKSEQIYFGPVSFHKGSEPFLTIAVADEQTGAGVTVAAVNLKFVSDVVRRIRVGASGYAYVVDVRGELIAHPDVSLVLRKSDFSALPQVRVTLTSSAAGAEVTEELIDAFDPAGNQVLAARARIAPLGWTVFVEQPLAEAFAPLYAWVAQIIFLFGLGLALAVAASLLLARRMVTPIQALQVGAARIGAGALDQRIEVKTGDELEALGAEFNRMADSLSESYAGLDQKITERTRELTTANRAVSRFLAVASHDLRQPMHALGLYVASLRDVPLPEEARRLVRQIMKSVTVSQDLLDGLLDISKLDAGAIKPNLTNMPVNLLLSRLQTNYVPLAREKGIEFRIATSRAYVHSDPILLERILLNITSNAVRYTRRGKILLGCRRRGGDLCIEVWDTGVGIPANEQRLVFEEFHRVGATERGAEKGFGLGLAIVDRLARLLNHAIEVRSWPGDGSVFTVVVPRAEGPTSEERASLALRAGVPLQGVRIIVVDDDPAGMKATQSLLESWGCSVLTATSAVEAIALSAKTPRRPPDIVICDFRLIADDPDTKGPPALRAAFPFNGQCILTTADASPDTANHAQEWGLPLLRKPVRPAKLRALLDHCLRLRAPRKRSDTRRKRPSQSALNVDG